jgi:uncharacterized RDD family membrane protein YckC
MDHAGGRQETVEYGGLWIRLVAFIIDAVIMKTVIVMLGFLITSRFIPERVAYFSYFGPFPNFEEVYHFVVRAGPLGLVAILLWWLYFTLLESSKLQGTLGKAVFGLIVIDAKGHRISWGRANTRYWSKILSGLIFYIGFLMIGWTEKKQGLHDKIANTFVRRSPPCKSLNLL